MTIAPAEPRQMESGGPSDRPGTVERAFQLARSGDCRSLGEIVTRLKREQHDGVDAHFAGPSIKRELRRICEANRD
jgi:hypothetical protein